MLRLQVKQEQTEMLMHTGYTNKASSSHIIGGKQQSNVSQLGHLTFVQQSLDVEKNVRKGSKLLPIF